MVMEPFGGTGLKAIYHQYIICQVTDITACPVHSNNPGFCAATASTKLAQSALAAIPSHDIIWVVWSKLIVELVGFELGILKAVQAEDLRPKPKPEPGLTLSVLCTAATDWVLRIPSQVISAMDSLMLWKSTLHGIESESSAI
ncbi:hypothetical protein LV164_006652 [Aspergillus fumigatus]|nr:hypothetical protein KXX42_002443 [Aspergillus fumigatus]KAH1552822.1 hypothetical protein KXX57_007441 [Aspergillus fumigatus]KAH1983164.1 hypothetical protein KXW88_003639 [Aspergillus fumigatus]KAH2311141.1 hypothetical protein KXV47_004742 [Aspergillus fumigatus]KAH2664036.1 hypothetical protein KXV32_008185 [Aspergillus fumigatus]